MKQNYNKVSRWIRVAARSTMLTAALLIGALTAQAQNLTVTVNGGTPKTNQTSLEAALQGMNLANISSISVSKGTFNTSDWDYLKNVSSLTSFEITAGVTAAADMPDDQFLLDPIETITLHKVKKIGNRAFYNCFSLSSVNLPNALTIGNNAFLYCTKLTSVDLPQATTISYAAFFFCTKLTSLYLPKVTTLDKGAFYGCTILKTIELPVITTIVANAFQGCSALSAIYLPKATTIGETAFDGCSSLNILGLGATPPTVGTNAFQGCPTDRILMLIDENNQPLTGNAQSNAATSYRTSSGWSNNKWHGWKLNAPYFITLEPATNGTIKLPSSCINLSGNTYAIPDGLSNIDLTLVGNGEYKPKQVNAFETGNPSNTVTLTGDGDTRRFTMPNHDVTVQAVFALKYNITATVSPDQSGSISGAGEYFDGTSVTLKATPAEGYDFVGWFEGSNSVSTNATYTFTCTGNRMLEAKFKAKTYTLTYNAGANGSISGTSPQTVEYNKNGEAVTAVPNEHYKFAKWSDGSTQNPRTDKNVKADITVTAQFEAITYTITATANPAAGGSVTGGGSYNSGATVTLKATPAEGYDFVGWFEGSNSVSSNATYTFTCTGNRTLEARFKTKTYTLTYNAGANGTISGTSPQTVEYNKNGEAVTAVPNEHYKFAKWSDGSTQNPRTDKNVKADITVTAQFEAITYTITATANPAAGGSVTGGGSYNSGATVTLKATPAEGYNFVGWFEGSSSVSTNATYTFTCTGNRTLEARFKAKTYTLTYNAGANGTISGTSPQTVEYNKNGEAVTAVPNEHYKFAQWSDGSTQNPRTDKNVKADITVTAQFEAITYTITATANPAAGGSVTGGGNYNSGATVTLTATANTGYDFVGWFEGSNSVSSNATYTFTCTGNRTLEARFKAKTYTLTYTAGANGTISGTSPQTVEYNKNGEAVTAVPNEHYQFAKWSDGSTQNPRTDKNVKADITVNAQFEAIKVTSVTLAPNPLVATMGDGPAQITATIEPANALNQNITWSSANNNVASVNNGLVSFVSVGSTTITATVDGVSATVNVTVNAATVAVTGITLTPNTLTLNVGQTQTLTASVVPQNATNQNIIWSSDNQSIATVSNGVVTAIAEGTTTITATTEDGGKTASCTVTVIIPKYTLTILPTTNGTVSSTATEFEAGDEVVLTIAPAEGYQLVAGSLKAYKTGEPSTEVAINANRFAMPNHDVTVEAEFEAIPAPTTYTITVVADPAVGGTVNGGGTYPEGTNITITANANEGYTFKQWNDGSTEATHTVSVTDNTTYTAYFEAITPQPPTPTTTYTITATAMPTEGGYVEGTGTYAEGTTITLKARAYAGYKFVRWSDGITTVERSVTVTADADYTAEFEADATITIHTVTATAEPAEGGSVSGARNYNANDIATLVATANTGYKFVHWTLNGQVLSPNAEYSFEVIEDIDLVAVFTVAPICVPITHEFDAVACQAYEWNGQTYTESGNYEQTLTTAAGCDSIVTLHLTVNKPFEGEFTIVTYNSYEWNGQTYTTSGDHQQHFTTAAGCDSTITLHLTIVTQTETETGLHDAINESLSISPNPTSTGFYIDATNADVRIYNISGLLVLQQSANGKTYVNISHLPAGTYIVRMGNAAAKVVKL